MEEQVLKKLRIYWASKLHGEDHREQNEYYASALRAHGHAVLLPQRHGIWEDMLRKAKEEGRNEKEALDYVKAFCFQHDMEDMRVANACILYANEKPPAEGAAYELGWMHARRNYCCLFIPDDETYKATNLMLTVPLQRFKHLNDLIDALKEVRESWNG
jgi:nucleoside 2-deoxyribosyltransferase